MSRTWRALCRASLLLALLLILWGITEAARIKRSPSGLLVGQVLDVNGNPLSESRVRLKELGSYHLPGEGNDAVGTYRGVVADTVWVETDKSGRFELRLPVFPPHDVDDGAQGVWELVLNASVCVPGKGASHPCAWRVERGKLTRAKFRLLPTGRVAGSVRDERGNPVQGVVVALTSRDTDLLSRPEDWISWEFSTQSGRDGSYRFDEMVPGEYEISAWGDSLVHVLPDSNRGLVQVVAGAVVLQEVLVIRKCTVSVRVLDANGLPLPHGIRLHPAACRSIPKEADGPVRVRFDFRPESMVHDGPSNLPQMLTLSVSTFDASEAAPAPSGPGAPLVRPPHSASGNAQLEVQEKLAGCLELDLSKELPADPEIRLLRTGTLLFDVRVGSSEKPAPSIDVDVVRLGASRRPGGGRDREGRRFYAVRRTAGKLAIEGVLPEEYELDVSCAGFRGGLATVAGSRRIRVNPGATVRLDPMRCVPLPRLIGRITAADPTLLRGNGVVVNFAPVEGGLAQSLRPVTVGADGKFSVPFAATGRFRAFLRPSFLRPGRTLGELQGGTVSDVFEFESVAGRETAVDLVLRVAPRLRVTVLESDGSPGVGHLVAVESVDAAIPLPRLDQPLSVQGDVDFGWLPSGQYIVSVLAPGDSIPRIRQQISLDSKEIVHDLRMRLP